MATKLFLRDSKDNGIGVYRDLSTTAGAGVAPLGEISTAASGTEIQWKNNGQAELLEWISGRAPVGGFTLSGTMTFSIWARESNMNANCGARARVFKRTAAGSESEIGGGPYNDGVEFGTGPGEFVWTGTPTSTAFAEDDRIIVRYYITNIGTMASGHTCSMDYGAPDASQGDSFFQINENVTFKAEEPPAQDLTPSLFTNTQSFFAPTVAFLPQTLTPSLFTNTQTFFDPTITTLTSLTPSLFTNIQTFHGPTITVGPVDLSPSLFTNENSFGTVMITTTYGLTPDLFTNTQTFFSPTVSGDTSEQTLEPSLFTNTQTFYSPTVTTNYTISPDLYTNDNTFFPPTVIGPQTLEVPLLVNSNFFYDFVIGMPVDHSIRDLEFALGKPFILKRRPRRYM